MVVPFLPRNGKKGMSHMDLSGFIPWYNRPSRPFPALVWVIGHYGFRVPPLTLARLAPAPWQPQREFPVKAWMRKRQMGGQ